MTCRFTQAPTSSGFTSSTLAYHSSALSNSDGTGGLVLLRAPPRSLASSPSHPIAAVSFGSSVRIW